MARSKWIRLKSPRELVHSVAARMLRSRLEAIRHFLPLAANKAIENDRYVHQLRVWTRRADAALELCRDLLTRSARRKLQEQLDLLRTAGGDARDADVFRDRIAALKPGQGREHLIQKSERRREAAQQPIKLVCEDLTGGRSLLRQLDKIEKRMQRRRDHSPFDQRFDRWAIRQFTPLVKKFLRQGQGDLSELARLHKFRIAGKRLRYALELVGETLGESVCKRAYRQLDRLQSQLGAINDTRNLVAELERSLAATKKRTLKTQLQRLLAAERRRLAVAQQAWQEAWKSKQAKQLRRAFKGLV